MEQIQHGKLIELMSELSRLIESGQLVIAYTVDDKSYKLETARKVCINGYSLQIDSIDRRVK
jgi:uncharacterized protein YfbU (UPF0304 family)